MLSAYLLSVGTLAASRPATVNVQTKLNVRHSASTSAKVVKELGNHTKVDVLNQSGSWCKISVAGKTGWVSKRYLSFISHAQAQKNASENTSSSKSNSPGKTSKLLNTAQHMLGVRYISSGSSPSGFDCSGLTKYVFSHIGISLPHSAAALSAYGSRVSKTGMKVGDILLFACHGGRISHVGIYVGGGYMIHAESGSVRRVVRSNIHQSYWVRSLVAVRRLI